MSIMTGAILDLPDRPFTRDDARTLIRQHAQAAATDDRHHADQYARLLAVALWRDVDPDYFREAVNDVATLAKINTGHDLDALFGSADGPDDPDWDLDDITRRNQWANYYEDAINFTIGFILDKTGY